MKIQLLFLCILFLTNSSNIFYSINDRHYVFDGLVITTGSNENGSYIKVLRGGDLIFQKSDVDCFYGLVDTININNDTLIDIIYSCNMEDYFCLNVLISSPEKKYIPLSIGDYFYPDLYCNDFIISDTVYYKPFLVGTRAIPENNRVIYINVINMDDHMGTTCMSDTIYIKNINSIE